MMMTQYLPRYSIHRLISFSAAGLGAAAVVLLAVAAWRRTRVGAFKGRLSIKGAPTNIDTLRAQFELNQKLWALKSMFDIEFVVSPSSGGPIPPPTVFEFYPSVASCGQPRKSFTMCALRGDLGKRRSAWVPAYVLRWLRWESWCHDAGASGSQSTSSSSSPSVQEGSFSSADAATWLPPKQRSGEALESGAVAGAIPDARRRRTVEERVMRVAFEVLAVPLTRQKNASCASMKSAVEGCTVTEGDLPRDAFAADASCSELIQASTVAAGARTGVSDYVTALLYVMDVAECNGEPLNGPRRIADEAATRIMSQHHGQLDSIARALEPIISASVAAELSRSPTALAEILVRYANVIGGYAINNCSPSCGALAADCTDSTINTLLDAGNETVLLLAFPMCSYGALCLMREIYDTAVAHFRSWCIDDFVALNAKLWNHSSTRVPSSWIRLFRSMNRSRSGSISFPEFCSHFAKKLSACGEDMDPDLALVLCLGRVRFTHLLFISRAAEWPRRSFWSDTLVDVHDNREP